MNNELGLFLCIAVGVIVAMLAGVSFGIKGTASDCDKDGRFRVGDSVYVCHKEPAL